MIAQPTIGRSVREEDNIHLISWFLIRSKNDIVNSNGKERESDSSIILLSIVIFIATSHVILIDECLVLVLKKSIKKNIVKYNYKICGHNLVFKILQRNVKEVEGKGETLIIAFYKSIVLVFNSF